MESNKWTSKKVVQEEVIGVQGRWGNKEKGESIGKMKIAYTNIDGYITSKLELEDYLRKENPDMMCIVETKLSEEIKIQELEINEGRYKVWRRDRAGRRGGGVMVMIKSHIKVDKVETGKAKAEILKMRVKMGVSKMLNVVVVYVPPKSNTWNREEYDEILRGTKKELERLMSESRELIIMGDFNCKEVDWENLETKGNLDSWGSVLLEIMMENIMTQWVTENTRFRGSDEPSRLDLVFSRGTDEISSVKYVSPLGKSDHVSRLTE